MPSGHPLRLPPPSGALLLDPLSTDQGGLLATTENFLTRYGSLRTRPGPQRLGDLTAVLDATERPMGSFWVRDKAGDVQLVVGTTKRWIHFDNSTRTWSDLSTVPLPLTGSVTSPVVFTYFEQGNNQYVLGVNDKEAAIEWQLGTASYALVSTGYIARSLCTVANRVFYGNVTIGGVRFPTMVAWSAAGDRTNNPALARSNLLDTGDHIVAVKRMGRLAAVVYREWSQWLATAVAGSDATAFQFSVQDRQPGPIGAAAIADGPGLRHVYLGSDLNLYTFDSVSSVLLAPTADVLRSRLDPTNRALVNVVYSPVDQEVWVTLPLDGDSIPTHVMVYSLQSQGVFFQRLPTALAVTMLGTWQSELGTPTDLLPDIPTDTLPDIPTNQLGFVAGQVVLLAGSLQSVFTLDALTDDTSDITATGEYLLPITEEDYEFDGLNVMIATPGSPVTVSVKVGPVFDQLTETVLGVVDPGIAAGIDTNLAAPGPNLAELRTPGPMRGRIVVIKFTTTTSQEVKIRRLEIFAFPKKRLA